MRKRTQVNSSSSSFFYNVSQRFQYLVYDFRTCDASQILKNTLLIDTVVLSESEAQFENTDKIQRFITNSIGSDQGLKQLFQQRKRNFNFFVPFYSSDSFTLFLDQKLEEIDRQSNPHLDVLHRDTFLVSVQNLQEICDAYEINRKTPFDYFSPLDKDSQKSDNEYNLSSFPESVRDLENLSKDDQKLFLSDIEKKDSMIHKVNKQQKDGQSTQCISQPDLSSYNVLDQPLTNFQIFKIVLNLIEVFASEKFKEIHLILTPLNIIFQKYPFLDNNKFKQKDFQCKTLPNEIIESKMYLGSAEHAKSNQFLVDQLKITHVVNCAREVQNHVQNAEYLNIQIQDDENEAIQLHFEEVYNFIDSIWENKNCRVLVHCAQGRSRSACLVIMFLMRKYKWNLKMAYEYVEKRREVISINEGFMRQLEIYDDKQQQQQQQ